MQASTGSILFVFALGSLSTFISPKLFATTLAFEKLQLKSSFCLSYSIFLDLIFNFISSVASFKNLADCVIDNKGTPNSSKSDKKPSAL